MLDKELREGQNNIKQLLNELDNLKYKLSCKEKELM